MKIPNKRKINKPENKLYTKKNKIIEQNKDLSNDSYENSDLIEELYIAQNNENEKSKVRATGKIKLDKENENHYNGNIGANKYETNKRIKEYNNNVNITNNSESKQNRIILTSSQQKNEDTVKENNERLKRLKKGAIIEITLFNWMVFSGPIKLKANEGINLIAAANASGKSSIVCALVFGLGYNSSILSRNKELINFIKKGEKKSYIEIFLKYDDTKNVCVKRIMNINDNKVESIWLINNKKQISQIF